MPTGSRAEDAHRGVRGAPVEVAAAGLRALDLVADAGVVAVADGHRVLPEGGEEGALLARDAFQVAHALRVGGGDEGDHPDLRLGDAAELGDLAGLVHPHLDDRQAVPGLEAEDHHGHAHAVVEVAVRAVDLAREDPLGERGGGDARRGLPRRARDADEGAPRAGSAPAAGVRPRQIAERDERVADPDHGEAGRRLGPPARSTTASAAPASAAAASRCAWPSWTSPRSATKQSPASIARVSVEIAVTRSTPGTTSSPPVSRTISATVKPARFRGMGVAIRTPPARAAARGRGAPRRDRRRGPSGPRGSGRARAPCRR